MTWRIKSNDRVTLMRKKIVIFDFDGTLADTLGISVDVYNEIAPLFGCRIVRENEIECLRKKRLHEFAKEYGVSRIKIPFLLFLARRKMLKGVEKTKPFSGINDVLRDMKSRDLEMGILTSNCQRNVEVFLRSNEMENIFDFVHCEKSIFGKDKALKKLCAERNMDLSSVVYVGDEIRDIEAMKKIQVPIIAVGWGFNSVSVLRECNPDYLVNAPEKILECL